MATLSAIVVSPESAAAVSPDGIGSTGAALGTASAVHIPVSSPSGMLCEESRKATESVPMKDSGETEAPSDSPVLQTLVADESTRGALDALAALASSAAAMSSMPSMSHPSRTQTAASVTPNLPSSDDDSDVMPPPPPRSPAVVSSGALFSSSPTQPAANMPSPSRAGRSRSASNPEGMEKWDSYSRRNDRQHFVLPSSILEEELASTRRVLGECDPAYEGQSCMSSVPWAAPTATKHLAQTHSFAATEPTAGTYNFTTVQTTVEEAQSLRSLSNLNLYQAPSLSDKKQSLHQKSNLKLTNVLGTSPNSVMNPLPNEYHSITPMGTSPPALATNRSLKPNRSSSPDGACCASSTNIVSGVTSCNSSQDEELVLEPEELLRRARSRLLEDLSEGASMSGEKGVLTLPHSLSKYKEVYNKNGRIGIYTPAERAAIINKFNAKRARRVWNKKIRYNCRKNLADRRMRVKGRFVKRSAEVIATSMVRDLSIATNLGEQGAEPNKKRVETNGIMNQSDKFTPTVLPKESRPSRPNTPPTSGSPLPPVNENEELESQDDEEMPDVDDEEAGFEPTEDMPYRRTRRYTIT